MGDLVPFAGVRLSFMVLGRRFDPAIFAKEYQAMFTWSPGAVVGVKWHFAGGWHAVARPAAVPELQHRRESPLRVRRARGHGGLCVLASSHPSLPSSSSPAPGAAASGPTRTWSSPLRCPTA